MAWACSIDMRKLRVAVVGAGYFGARHAENYAAIDRAELVAVCDIDAARAGEVAARVGAEPVSDHRSLLDRVDAVSVATPTASHRPIAGEFLSHGIPVLLEKPMSRTLEEADELIRLAEESGTVLQIGHLERFNAAVLSAGDILDRPRFIDCRRIAQYRQRGTDISVVLDLMIHDIDLVLDIVKAPIDWIDAVGVPVLSDADDIANARIRFTDGSVATITASRVSWKTERSIRIFQPNAYILVDLNDSKLVVTRKVDGDGRSLLSQLDQQERKFEAGGNLKRELEAFLHSVETGEPPLVTGADGRRALAAALTITEQLQTWRAGV
jgi:predicted dehydrogenase